MNKDVARLNKIAGQVMGIAKMVEHNENCEKIVVQFQAVKGALSSVLSDILNNNLDKCLRENQSEEAKNILKYIIKK